MDSNHRPLVYQTSVLNQLNYTRILQDVGFYHFIKIRILHLANLTFLSMHEIALGEGFEPPTKKLTASCSTTELHQIIIVPMTGVEPARPVDTTFLVWHVYQFHHMGICTSGGSRTHRTWFLKPIRLPVTSQRHLKSSSHWFSHLLCLSDIEHLTINYLYFFEFLHLYTLK